MFIVIYIEVRIYKCSYALGRKGWGLTGIYIQVGNERIIPYHNIPPLIQ